MATILQLIQSFCEEQGNEVPASVVGNTDAGVLQMKRLLDKVGRDIRRRSNWQALSRRITWNSVAAEDQGAVATLLTENPEHIIPETFWDTTARQKIIGPISDVKWQEFKTYAPTTTLYKYRIAGGHLYVLGPLPANDVLSLIYKTKNWLLKTAPSTYIDAIDADTNVPVFDDDLMLLGLMAYWRKAKELSYDQDYLKFSNACFDAASVDNVKPIVRMDSGSDEKYPIFSGPIGGGAGSDAFLILE